MLPPLSFIMPAYNCAGTIAESVGSILGGNLEPGDEIVIVDDGSDTASKGVLAELAARHEAVRVVPHRFNKGGGAARNTAVEAARHDLIFCLDSDNILEPGSVAAVRRYQLEEKADMAAFQQIKFFRVRPDNLTHLWQLNPGEYTLADFFSHVIAPSASGNYLYTAEAWRRARGYPVDSHHLDAWGFDFRLLAAGARARVLPGFGYRHRHGIESYWIRGAREKRTSLYALQIILPYLNLIEPRDVRYLLSPRGRRGWLERLGRRPLRLIGQPVGRGGIQTDPVGRPEAPPSLPQKLARLLRRAVRGPANRA